MYVKQCIAALAGVITIGLATTGYAQGTPGVLSKITSAAHSAPAVNVLKTPGLLTMEEALNIPQSAIATLDSFDGSQPRSTTNAPIYRDGATGYFWYPTLHDALDDIFLSAGLSAGAGTTITAVYPAVRNTSTTTPEIVYGSFTFYDKLDGTQANAAVSPLPHGSYNFTSTATLAVSSAARYKVTLSTTTPLVLTRDLTTGGGAPYGVSLSLYTDATRTTLSTDLVPVYSYNTMPSLGYSSDTFYVDNSQNGTYQGPYITGQTGYQGSLYFGLDGTSANDLTYSLAGTLHFPTATTGASLSAGQLLNVQYTIFPHAGGGYIQFSGQSYVYDGPADPVTGATAEEDVDYLLIGFAPDTYDIVIQPDNVAYDASNTGVVVSNANVYGLDAEFDTPAEPVNGTFSLEGVADLSATSPGAPLDSYYLSFRTPGTTTELYTFYGPVTPAGAGSANATFNVFVPDGTYDVFIETAKNLAVLVPNVTVSASSLTVPDFGPLPAGDADSNNVVNTSDFNALTGAFGNAYDPTDPTNMITGYDPTVDFNFDGVINTGDFNLLVGEFGNAGSPLM